MQAYSQNKLDQEEYKTILQNLGDGVIVFGPDDRILVINQTAREYFKLGQLDLTGKKIGELFQNGNFSKLATEARDGPSHGEIHFDDGRVLNAQASPVPGIGLAITFQDITQLKELDRIKSEFVSTVSHDLRSPLTAILGYIELIDRVGTLNDQQREFIRRAQFSVKNITSLMDDLLDLGRIEAGYDTQKEIAPIPAILEHPLAGVRSRIAAKEQQLIVDVPDNLPPILGNIARLRQMISNLVDNSIKYTPEKGQITIRARTEGDQIILQVSDNGPGIPPADQPHIFDKFFRGSNINFDGIPGTGLGLAIVRSIVENHQGRIWVESVLGRGSTFTVVLPASI